MKSLSIQFCLFLFLYINYSCAQDYTSKLNTIKKSYPHAVNNDTIHNPDCLDFLVETLNNNVNITVDIPAVIAADKSNSKRYVIGGGALAKPLNLARPVAQAITLKTKIPIMIFPFTFIFSRTIIATLKS